MRGADLTQESLFTVRKTADYVPWAHPLIRREIVNTALREMDYLLRLLRAQKAPGLCTKGSAVVIPRTEKSGHARRADR